jgi:hypothetical protein
VRTTPMMAAVVAAITAKAPIRAAGCSQAKANVIPVHYSRVSDELLNLALLAIYQEGRIA